MRSRFVVSIVAVAVASVAFRFRMGAALSEKRYGCLGDRLGFGSALR
jgi:hypothetical protein